MGGDSYTFLYMIVYAFVYVSDLCLDNLRTSSYSTWHGRAKKCLGDSPDNLSNVKHSNKRHSPLQ